MKKVNKVKNDRVKEDYDKPFPCLLRELRKEYNISQDEIAKVLKTTRQSISKYELGETFPDIYSAQAIVEFFNKKCNLDYSMDYWFGKEEISKGIKRKDIPLSNTSIELLQEYEKDYRLIATLEMLLKERRFLKNLSRYIVDERVVRDVVKKESPKEFKTIESYLPKSIGRKFMLYDVQEELPLFKKYAENRVEEELKGKVSIHQYVAETLTNQMMEAKNLKDNFSFMFFYLKNMELMNKTTNKSKVKINRRTAEKELETLKEFFKNIEKL